MVSANWGRIVNVSSAAARHPVAGMAAYGASKAALDQLTRVLALEGEPYGISVTGVYPGVIDTRMQEESTKLRPEPDRQTTPPHVPGLQRLQHAPPPRRTGRANKLPLHPSRKRLNGHIIRLEQLEAIKAEP